MSFFGYVSNKVVRFSNSVSMCNVA